MLQELKVATTDALRTSVVEPGPGYRTAIGVLGVTLPPLLWAAEGRLHSSISAYYYTRARDLFVGILWVFAVFLLFYRYQPRGSNQDKPKSRHPTITNGFADAYLGKIAGACALAVALLPTTPPPGSSAQPPLIGFAHGTAATVLFTALALFPLVLFSQSKKRVGVYKSCGWLMLASLVTLATYAFSPEALRAQLAPLNPVFWLECVLIGAFGVSWFVKGQETGEGVAAAPLPRPALPPTGWQLGT